MLLIFLKDIGNIPIDGFFQANFTFIEICGGRIFERTSKLS